MMIWYDHDWGWGWGGWLLMTAGMLVFWGLVIWGVAWLVRSSAPASPGRPTPEQVLADRFARGDIEEAEYHRRLDTLRAGRAPAGRR